MRKANNQLGDKYTNEQLANMLNEGYSNSGLEYTFTLPEKFKSDRKKKAEGGEIDDQMLMVMTPPMESEMEPDGEMEDGYTRFIMEEALSEDEEDMLMSKLEQDEELQMLFDKVIDVAQEFAGSGEFVFTAKAVEEIGEDALMSMMKDAEAKADKRQGMRIGGIMSTENSEVDQYGRPLDAEIAEEEVKKSMLSVNPRFK